MKKQDINRDVQYPQESDERRVSMPETALRLQADERDFVSGMTEYIRRLKAQTPDVAQKEARAALIRTGVLTEDGKKKESIVSWE